MKSKSTFYYHAFYGFLFAILLFSCNSESEQPSSISSLVNRQSTISNKSYIPPNIKSLLAKNTCLGCHKLGTKLIGPSFKEIAARNYNSEEMVALIKQPVPENWPDYPPMAPVTWVADEDIATIVKWIGSLSIDE